MVNAFTQGPSIENDIHETLLRILEAFDPTYLRGVDLAQFKKGLLDEVHFLVPCDEDEMRQIEHYVHQYASELYRIALADAVQSNAVADR